MSPEKGENIGLCYQFSSNPCQYNNLTLKAEAQQGRGITESHQLYETSTAADGQSGVLRPAEGSDSEVYSDFSEGQGVGTHGGSVAGQRHQQRPSRGQQGSGSYQVYEHSEEEFDSKHQHGHQQEQQRGHQHHEENQQPESSHRQQQSSGRGQQGARQEQERDSSRSRGSNQGHSSSRHQADSPRVSSRSGSGGRGQSPDGSGHSGVQGEARRGQSSSAHRRAGSSSGSGVQGTSAGGQAADASRRSGARQGPRRPIR
ncbi:filaggrin-like [Mus pahari]|uniref:filaggrin-like n=1 Tax=Mus pahari TaxID=10093 RepID=UPI000A30526C|nr:filaggrin-like [Mus pahari]